MLELLLSTSGGLTADVEDPGDSGGELEYSCLGLWAADMFANKVWKELADGYRPIDGGRMGGPVL